MTKASKRMVDMSPEAVATRLEEVRALYKLVVSLADATILGRTEDRRSNDNESQRETAHQTT